MGLCKLLAEAESTYKQWSDDVICEQQALLAISRQQRHLLPCRQCCCLKPLLTTQIGHDNKVSRVHSFHKPSKYYLVAIFFCELQNSTFSQYCFDLSFCGLVILCDLYGWQLALPRQRLDVMCASTHTTHLCTRKEFILMGILFI